MRPPAPLTPPLSRKREREKEKTTTRPLQKALSRLRERVG
jgi:hypothetical protein